MNDKNTHPEISSEKHLSACQVQPAINGLIRTNSIKLNSSLNPLSCTELWAEQFTANLKQRDPETEELQAENTLLPQIQ